MWADRMLNSAIEHQLIGANLATQADLERISDAWKEWAEDEDGWSSILHGEILYRVSSPAE
ncbi:hypothetical protein D4765_13615 [Subtercola vilae]|uniref:Uncharacterized protein n=2 Tax=Subtercola vilae TaxID=2056433 RepID=A0A4T2BQP0_9MICO|nr:hypothetical protein D4765_13615 [Subtercola vilae]